MVDQRRLITSLGLPVVETHISYVLFDRGTVYKIKKAVRFPFLDFTTLAAREFYCREELRLNGRLAPSIYLDVVPITGTADAPVLGGDGPPIEYAVKMREFDQNGLLSRVIARDELTTARVDALAAAVAGFHERTPRADPATPYGRPEGILADARANFAGMDGVDALRAWTETEGARCAGAFIARRQQGFVRECHGDLHLGNIVLLDDMPTPFDGIEFNASLRWIDVISEISFPVMDLLRRGRPQLAWRLLNAYLEITGDYSGVGVLRFYLAYRAMVRAKIAAIRAGQRSDAKVDKELKSCRSYFRLAHSCLTRRRPALIITHGLPGCGKSTFAQIALERLGAIRIRSDVERKRMFGLEPLADSKAQIGADIYSEDATRRTYARLNELARGLFSAGFPVIVDAAFVLHAEREVFRALAQEMAVPFVIASLQTDVAVMEERIKQRNSLGNDASEADILVLRKLQLAQAPLLDEELADTITFANNNDVDALRADSKGWKSLDARLA